MNLFADWQETMLDLDLNMTPKYKTIRDQQILEDKKNFLNEQLAMHKPRKSIIILPSRERHK